MGSPPPVLEPGETAVLFDGTCKLCNGWANLIIRHDGRRRIRLATVQSPEGQALLAWAELPTDRFNTIVLIHGEQVFVRSDAMFEIFTRLSPPWRLLNLFKLVPRPLRDWVYDKIALNRYKLFGRFDACVQPHADHPRRFLRARG
ncbi:MAG TPA: thiol-disulfide oxidoreductase DCC family protein [Pseudomonas sp.]|uniref:thiol-disulfide oxidoreductase DCC family protein n=1 Tax=Pseudomonas sp. TaxID=306 RepID=UPI002B49204F|nr:thiol-disulfide oxidoreductase DCC family protein [Pseudomonas sp.]HKS14335.1 thiol-disulfide oxidoreductase DCC family protein [Pseudomonas sp.]